MSQTSRVLAVLKDGNPHSIEEIHERAGSMRLNSRIAELRTRGHNIVCIRHREWDNARKREQVQYQYRLVSSALDSGAAAAAPDSSADVGNAAVTSSAALAGEHAEASLSPRDTRAPALSLDDYGIDRAISEANADTPGLLVEPDAPLTMDEQRRRLVELQQSLFGRAA